MQYARAALTNLLTFRKTQRNYITMKFQFLTTTVCRVAIVIVPNFAFAQSTGFSANEVDVVSNVVSGISQVDG